MPNVAHFGPEPNTFPGIGALIAQKVAVAMQSLDPELICGVIAVDIPPPGPISRAYMQPAIFIGAQMVRLHKLS